MNTTFFHFAGCSILDLGDPVVDGNPSVCVEGEVPLFINGGTVCYNGTSPGSTAVYHCGEGYEVAGNNTRDCQSNDKWEGELPVCKESRELEEKNKTKQTVTSH